MKKILVIINGPFTPQHVIDTAIELSKAGTVFLHAFFLNYDFRIADYNYPFPNDLSLTVNRLTGKTMAEENAELLQKSKEVLRRECERAKVDFIIDEEEEISIGKLIAYSAFSDLILSDSMSDSTQYHLVDILVNAHCPVYLVSRNAKPTKNVVFCYDGTPSCMKAIKMFSYLFPEHQKLHGCWTYVASDSFDKTPQEDKFQQWISGHFDNVQKQVLYGDARKELVSFINFNSSSFIVMGAYGRTAISRLFHQSLANTIIEQTNSSIFISHE